MIGNLASNALPQLCDQFPVYYIMGHVHIPVVTVATPYVHNLIRNYTVLHH